MVAVLALFASACGLAEEGADQEEAASPEDTGGTVAPEAETPATAAEGASGEPISIGATLPLTGAFADTGAFVAEGYEDWVDNVNEEGGLLGRPVELTIEDDTSDVGRATSLLERLITQDEVDLVLGGYPGSSAAAQMAIAEQYGKVYVSMGGHLSSFEQGYEYVFGAPPLMGEWWYRGFFDYLEQLPEEERPSSAAMVTINNPVGAAVRDGTLADLERVGIELVMDELYDAPLASADTLVNQAMQSEAELFIANSFFPDGVLIVRSVNALGYQPDALLEGIGTLIPSWSEELGEEGNYVISGTAMHPDLPFADVQTISELSEQRYATDQAPIYYMFGATWAQVLVEGVRGADSLDDAAIRDWLKSNEVTTIGGTFTFDERGLPEPYSYATQVIDGVAELVLPPDVATTEPVYPIPWDE
jgi:branched-chain amino acid transport system substrate-binding protein